AGNKVSLTVADPRSDVTEQEIKDAMEVIVTNNIFAPNGSELVEALEARVVKTDTTDYDLEV
ncbi:DUF2922 domain-containing protein, partial [Romboutsia weinsteinii]